MYLGMYVYNMLYRYPLSYFDIFHMVLRNSQYAIELERLRSTIVNSGPGAIYYEIITFNEVRRYETHF